MTTDIKTLKFLPWNIKNVNFEYNRIKFLSYDVYYSTFLNFVLVMYYVLLYKIIWTLFPFTYLTVGINSCHSPILYFIVGSDWHVHGKENETTYRFQNNWSNVFEMDTTCKTSTAASNSAVDWNIIWESYEFLLPSTNLKCSLSD